MAPPPSPVENCDIFENECAGIEIKEGADPVVFKNRIFNGVEAGVLVHDGGRGRLERNDIYGNKLMGVAVQQGGDPHVLFNRIREGQSSGVMGAREAGRGRDWGNAGGMLDRVLLSRRIPIEADWVWWPRFPSPSSPHFDPPLCCAQCGRARGDWGHGLRGVLSRFIPIDNGREWDRISYPPLLSPPSPPCAVHSGGLGTFEGNEIWGNALMGFDIGAKGRPRLFNNSIYSNAWYGVYHRKGAEGVVEHRANRMYDNKIGSEGREH